MSKLEYGLSITDPCIDWSTTESLLLKLHDSLQNALRPRRLGPVRHRDAPFGSEAACGAVAVDQQRPIGMSHVIQIRR